jgi:SAM-dependent methyltransferase
MTENVRRDPPFWRHDWYTLRCLRAALESALRKNSLAVAGETVLDFGCGDRPYEPLLVARGAKYIAADLDGAADVTFTPGQPLPMQDQSVHGVVSFQVLEHVWDLDWYLAECRRVLRPGGWLLLSTHGSWPYHPHPTDFRRWTRDGLLGEISGRGFTPTACDAIVGLLALTTQFRLLGYREALRKIPIVGPIALAGLAMAMNARMLLEDALTPAAIRDVNACVYVTVSRVSGA